MKLHRAFRYRIYPAPEQERRLLAWQDALRFLWNLALEQRLWGLARERAERRYYTFVDQSRQLMELRNELPWLREVPRHLCDKVLRDLDIAWRRCFSCLARQPRWKRKGRDAVGLCETDAGAWSLATTTLTFPKVGGLRARVHRALLGKASSCTLMREADQWFAVILCQIELPDPSPRLEPVVGLDRGVVNLVADSDGQLVSNPRNLQRSLRRLARAQRKVARRKKGSLNQRKAREGVTKIHRKIRRQRDHVLHAISATYAKSHGSVVIEKLRVKQMSASAAGSLEKPGTNVRAKSGLNRAILDAGWGRLAFLLRYKLEERGGRLVEVPAAWSSQTCSSCGGVNSANRRNQASFACVSCGYAAHADVNAAKVIKSRAVEATVSGCGGVSIGRPVKQQRKLVRASRQHALRALP